MTGAAQACAPRTRLGDYEGQALRSGHGERPFAVAHQDGERRVHAQRLLDVAVQHLQGGSVESSPRFGLQQALAVETSGMPGELHMAYVRWEATSSMGSTGGQYLSGTRDHKQICCSSHLHLRQDLHVQLVAVLGHNSLLLLQRRLQRFLLEFHQFSQAHEHALRVDSRRHASCSCAAAADHKGGPCA